MVGACRGAPRVTEEAGPGGGPAATEAAFLPAVPAGEGEPTEAAFLPAVPAGENEPTGEPAPDAAEVSCQGPLEPTPPNAEGPFYKAGSPERTDLTLPELTGERLELTGRVLTSDCEPIAGAAVDFWQTDAGGNYDNAGFNLRGVQFTDADGRYELFTILPGRYPGRPPHIHVKVRPPGGDELTTQIYFIGIDSGGQDSLFDERLAVESVQDENGAWLAVFDFVLSP
jgi:protocatechuate 3,4-dioxygenase beta subunit